MGPAPGKQEGAVFRKKDGVLIALVLILALGLFLYQQFQSSQLESTGQVRIWVDGKIYKEVALGKAQSIPIRQENGCENVVRLTENGFYMEQASCDNQLCIGQGEVTNENFAHRALGTHVLCLPNRVDVELLLSPEQAQEIPDI